MRLHTYSNLFRELARRHVAIQATADNGRFMRILISADPVQKQFDLTAFYGELRNLKVQEGDAFLVLENYQVDYDDNHGDYYSRKLDAAYLVLRQVDPANFDARDAAIGACEEIAEDILAAVKDELLEQHNTFMTVGDAWAEHIGPLADGYVGVRMNLSWKEPATQELVYNSAKFLP